MYVNNYCNLISYDKFVDGIYRTVKSWKSSPGWPFKKEHSTMEDLLGWNGYRVDEHKTRYIYHYFVQRWSDLFYKPTADPIYVFVKEEPHKQKKAQNHAWRLISGVSFVDRMVDYFLFGQWFMELQTNWDSLPNKVGWAPSGGGYRWMRSRIHKPICYDKEAWDWTVQGWLVDLLYAFTLRMNVSESLDWQLRVKNRLISIFSQAEFKWQDGCYMEQRVCGIMKSGLLGTIAWNSWFQYALHTVALVRLGERPVWNNAFGAMGDDTIQELDVPDGYAAMIESLGCKLKEPVYGYEFAGTIFNTNPHPAYMAKHMFAMQYAETEDFGTYEEMIASYQYLYAFDEPMLKLLHKTLCKMDRLDLVRSRPYVQAWYDGY